MNFTTRPASSRWALLVLTAAALALAGCGRKGGLDLPPQSSAQPLASSAPAIDPDTDGAAGKGSALFNAAPGDNGQPLAAKGRKKPFILDPLLD
ncbi:MAG TPA: lipoprotein [Tardiphaga sp.]